MRSIWNGAISFGLVSIPIKVVNATESHNVSFRQIHLEDGGRIRYRKVCELEDREVSSSEIGKGYEEADGSIIPITEEDMESLPISTARTIEIVAFVPDDRIDPLQMSTAYYLAANGATATKPYVLLREALKRSEKVAVAKFALRGRERLGMLRVVDDVIAMHGLLWPDEVRGTEEVAPEAGVGVRDAELDLADALMDTLGEVDIDSLRDDYREAVEEMISAKAGGEPVPQPSRERSSGKVLDLMSALESSVSAAKKARGESGGGKSRDAEEASEELAEVARLPRTSRRSARTEPKEVGGKKSTSSAKKGAAKKTAARKTSATGRGASGDGEKASGRSTGTKRTTGKSSSGSAAKKSGGSSRRKAS